MRGAVSHLARLRIGLSQELQGDTVYKEFIEKHGYGVQYGNVLLVDDMAKAVDRVVQQNLRITVDVAGFGG